MNLLLSTVLTGKVLGAPTRPSQGSGRPPKPISLFLTQYW